MNRPATKPEFLQPKRRRLGDRQYCFFGHAFEHPEALKVKDALERYLTEQGMKVCPPVAPGQWLWHGLMAAMDRSAFCAFETESVNANVHVELGYALCKGLRVVLLVRDVRDEETGELITRTLSSDLAGFVRVPYCDPAKLHEELARVVPPHWTSVARRLHEDLRQLGDLDRTYLEILLGLPADRDIQLHELVRIGRDHGRTQSSNVTLADFLARLDEVLVVEGGAPPDVDGQYYDWRYSTPPIDVDHLHVRVDPEYRDFLLKNLAIAPCGSTPPSGRG